MKERRVKIIDAAIEIFGLKGFKNATISEIAAKAGVGDATIYEYFDSKEGLLLSIPYESTNKIIEELRYHMLGIKGAFNKIRKVVWWWFSYMERSPGYGVIILLELKTSKNFLQTEAYQKAREFYQMFTDIIIEGQEEGAIKKGIDVHIARSVIIGALEHNIIRWLLMERSYSLTACADELTDLFVDMLKLD